MRCQGILPKDHLQDQWLSPPESLKLSLDEIHIWRAGLKMTALQVKTLEHLLSADELSRAGRFHFRKDRDNFIVARGLLRTILGMYVKRNPADLIFCSGLHGKPLLHERTNAKGLLFNASHSQGLALFAVAREREIGVDLEYIRPDLSVRDLVDQVCSQREADVLKAIPEHLRLEAFYTLWTRKEAYLKAHGMGLARNPREIDVIGSPGDLAETIEIRDVQQETQWLLRDVHAAAGFAAALAVAGKNLHMRCWQWEDDLLETMSE